MVVSFAPYLLQTSFSWQGDDKFFIFNLRIAEIFLRSNVWIDNTVFSAEEFCLFVSSLFAKVVPCSSILTAWIRFVIMLWICIIYLTSFCFYQAKTLRNKDLIEMYLSPLITCIPGLISNAPDDSKGYLLEVLIDLLSSL